MKENVGNSNKKLNIAFTVVAVVLIVIILPILICAVTLMIKAAVNPDDPPSIFSYAPLTVASGSMEGTAEDCFNEGDLIFIKVLDDDEKQSLDYNDIICYRTDGIFVTHRIISITYANDGTIATLTTMGDANYAADDPITLDAVYGIYTGRIANLGDFAEFLQTAGGMALFIGIPIAAFILFDVARFIITKRKKTDEENIQSKDEEIARLKKLLEEQSSDQSADQSPADPATPPDTQTDTPKEEQ